MSKVHIVMYHYVRDLNNSRYSSIRGLDVSAFREQIAFFRNSFVPISMEEVIEYYENGTPIPDKSVLLTFDDGYIDHFTEVFPILMENGIQGSFFVPAKVLAENKLLDVNKIHFLLASTTTTVLYEELLSYIDDLESNHECNLPDKEYLIKKYAIGNRFDTGETIFIKRMLQTVLPEKIRNRITSVLFEKYVSVPENVFAKELYMNLEQIKCMKKCGMFFGLHGYDHYWLGNLERDKMEKDINQAVSVLSDVIDPDAIVMNYPYGSYNNNVVAFLQEMGCKVALTTEARIADFETENKLLLPRMDCNDYPPKSNRYINA